MDEAVWFWAGMISVIIGLAVLSRVAIGAAEQNTQNTIENSLNQLTAQCDFVCKQERGTRLGVRVSIPMGSIVTAQDELICIEHSDKRQCAPCECRLSSTTALDLTAPEAQYFPRIGVYECRFHHNPPIEMSCMG
jgi:hypothetical protein